MTIIHSIIMYGLLLLHILLLGRLNRDHDENKNKPKSEYEYENDLYRVAAARETHEETGLIEGDDYTVLEGIYMQYTTKYPELGVVVTKETTIFAAEMNSDKFDKQLIFKKNERNRYEHKNAFWMNKEAISVEKKCIKEFKEKIKDFENDIRNKQKFILKSDDETPKSTPANFIKQE